MITLYRKRGDVLDGKIDTRVFRNGIMLVGAYAPGMQDSYNVAVQRGQPMYGVEIHADMIEAFLEGKTVVPVSVMGYALAVTAIALVFLLSGMLTNYLDFLTTETLTLLVPLLLVLWIDLHVRRRTMHSVAVNAGKAALLWLLGYGGMWMTKWILASLVLGENVLPYITGHIQQRVGSGGLQFMLSAVVRNVKCLFPLEYGAAGMMAAIGITLILIYEWVFKAAMKSNP